MFSLGVSVCTHTRQVEHQRCSRTGRVQKNHKIFRKKHNILWKPCMYLRSPSRGWQHWILRPGRNRWLELCRQTLIGLQLLSQLGQYFSIRQLVPDTFWHILIIGMIICILTNCTNNVHTCLCYPVIVTVGTIFLNNSPTCSWHLLANFGCCNDYVYICIYSLYK